MRAPRFDPEYFSRVAPNCALWRDTINGELFRLRFELRSALIAVWAEIPDPVRKAVVFCARWLS